MKATDRKITTASIKLNIVELNELNILQNRLHAMIFDNIYLNTSHLSLLKGRTVLKRALESTLTTRISDTPGLNRTIHQFGSWSLQ